MSVGLSGNLRDFGIADVFQLIGQQRKTGILELKRRHSRVQLVFDNGGVVSAAPVGARATDPDPLSDMLVRCGLLTRRQSEEVSAECRAAAQPVGRVLAERDWVAAEEVRSVEDLLTRDTIFEVLRWESGSFDFRAEEVSHDRDPRTLLGAEQILMDGLRMVDEWQSFEEFVPSDETVFQRVGRFEDYRRECRDASPARVEEAERVFALLDGRLSTRRVIDLSRLGTFDGTRILADLRRTEVIKSLKLEGVRHLRRQVRASEGRAALLVRVLAVFVPMLLLLVAATLAGDRPPSSESSFRIQGETLSGLRDAYAARRVRNALEAHRLAEGRWPERLEELSEGGLLQPEALATPPGRPYYYAHRSGAGVLLAPER